MTSPSTTADQWYNKTWLVILLCILFFPVGLYALWKSNRFTMGWKIGISAIIALIVIVGITADPPAEEATASSTSNTNASPQATAAKPLTWQIVKTDSTNRQLTFRITINDRTDDKAQLFEIARQLKEDRNWKEELVCFFDIKVPSRTFAWASCGYLPHCDDCGTDKDSEGDPIAFRLIGMTPSLADSLRVLTLDTIANKTLVTSYLDDVMKVKKALYRVDNEPKRLLSAMLANGGGKLLEWHTLKEIDGQKRYYFPDDDEGNYLVIDETSRAVNFYNGKGDWWQSVAMEE